LFVSLVILIKKDNIPTCPPPSKENCDCGYGAGGRFMVKSILMISEAKTKNKHSGHVGYGNVFF
jgi:hypothetical protein